MEVEGEIEPRALAAQGLPRIGHLWQFFRSVRGSILQASLIHSFMFPSFISCLSSAYYTPDAAHTTVCEMAILCLMELMVGVECHGEREIISQQMNNIYTDFSKNDSQQRKPQTAFHTVLTPPNPI